MKLICLDMDGVIFKGNNLWMDVHRVFGTLEEGKGLTERYLKTDYTRLVEEVVTRLWKGKDAKPYLELIESKEYVDGVKELFDFIHERKLMTAIVSAASMDLARRVQRDFGVDHLFANDIVIENGKISGRFLWPIGVGREKKAEVIRDLAEQFGIAIDEIAYIGDSDTDIEAFKEVGLSIAFNSDCAELKEVATFVVDSCDLRDVIHVLESHQ